MYDFVKRTDVIHLSSILACIVLFKLEIEELLQRFVLGKKELMVWVKQVSEL